MYSDKHNSIYCFVYKLFGSGVNSLTLSVGFSDWKNTSACLKSHESSEAHLDCLIKWKDLNKGLQKDTTISQAHLYLERERWRSVLKHLIAITLSLVERNLAF